MTGNRINYFVFDDSDNFVDLFSIVSSNREKNKPCESKEPKNGQIVESFDITFYIDGYCLSVFHYILSSSVTYRKLTRKYLLNVIENVPESGIVNCRVQLVHPKAEVLDLEWNYRISRLIAEKQELEYSMSWLSTLGGAFSALGDNFEHCAKVAGKISVQQLQIALRLGDPQLVARCKLYMSLSLIQQKKLKIARHIVEEQYRVAKDFKDFRLVNMCKGIWSKLQYTYKLKKLANNCNEI